MMAPRKRRRKKRPDDPPAAAPKAAPGRAARAAAARPNPVTAALQPLHRLGSVSTTGSGDPGPSGAVHGRTITLEGVTHFTFNPEQFSVGETPLQQGSDCDGCEGRDCVSVSTEVTITYSVTTNVVLPSPDDFPGLSDCERANVQNAIDTVLAPHEQEHVDTLHQYDGTETVPFSATFCRGDFDRLVAEFASAREQARRAPIEQQNRDLDPFSFTFDPSEGCEEQSAAPEAPPTEVPEAPTEEEAAPDSPAPAEPVEDTRTHP